ncbi:Alpha/Beta hydrolase protein [Clohesyomyces aquaticus]|uniref:Carboxylic ester hydrolase n=1 Tax=Clohesyomyces aquaticus TaxID=1231657 RepID=A0A1Y1ZYZ5_9PLEO|nr:Alpha/Beta hydrolase protein [Clohesyomyces aquaticus]
MGSQNSHTGTFTFEHPELGSMTGLITPDNVVQFRAIPYATIPARFKHSILLNNLSKTNRDFTKYGFACPHSQPPDAAGGGSFPGEPWPSPQSELDCLILQVNVPLACLQPQSSPNRLPVLVYIHGGGFVLGKIDAQHNTSLLVSQSISDSQPLISVSLQYRLGALGYLKVPGGSNFAPYDQRNALLWIQKFIKGFGGDEKKVTVFGESAGGMSICYHMLAAPPPSGPLFNRVVLMSGVIGPMCAPIPEMEADKVFEQVCEILEIKERGEEAVERLRGMEVEKIVFVSDWLSGSGGMWLPTVTEEWFGEEFERVSWDRIPELLGRCEWVDEVVLGTTGIEGMMFMPVLSFVPQAIFISTIEEQLGKEAAAKMFRAYNITPTMDPNLFLSAAIRWIGDVIFDSSNHTLARHLALNTNKKVYRYLFDVRSPFPGQPFYQTAHHWVDVYFVFRGHQFRYPTEALKRISDQHARMWTTFANGKQPWTEYNPADGKEVIMVADERDGWVERSVAEEEKLNERSWTRCELLWDAWAGKKGEWFLPLKIAPLEGKKLV